jgi:hypothetical protein
MDTMPRPCRPPLVLACAPSLLLALSLAACAPSRTDMSTSNPESDTADAGPVYRVNPQPKRAYAITLRIADAPGPFASVEGFAQYNIVNQDCLPAMNTFSGAQSEPNRTTPSINFVKVSDDTYTATVYVDLMQDADYFGNGVCRWEFVMVRAQLRATGDKAETEFLPTIRAESVLAQESETKYFPSWRYPRSDIDDFPSFGNDPDYYKSDLRSDLFSITLAAKEVAP